MFSKKLYFIYGIYIIYTHIYTVHSENHIQNMKFQVLSNERRSLIIAGRTYKIKVVFSHHSLWWLKSQLDVFAGLFQHIFKKIFYFTNPDERLKNFKTQGIT